MAAVTNSTNPVAEDIYYVTARRGEVGWVPRAVFLLEALGDNLFPYYPFQLPETACVL